MAYQSWQLVSRLRLYSSWRKPRKDWTLCEKCHSRVDAYRTVAWRIMELCLVGSRFWSASFVRAIFMGKMAGTNAVYYFAFVFAFYYFTQLHSFFSRHNTTGYAANRRIVWCRKIASHISTKCVLSKKLWTAAYFCSNRSNTAASDSI